MSLACHMIIENCGGLSSLRYLGVPHSTVAEYWSRFLYGAVAAVSTVGGLGCQENSSMWISLFT